MSVQSSRHISEAGEDTPLLADVASIRSDATLGAAEAEEDDLLGLDDDPREWPSSYKWCIVALLSFSSFTVTFGCVSVAPVANRIVSDLDGGAAARSSAVLLVTIWEIGEAAGPLLIGPLSEMLGRWPLYNVANVFFILATILGSLSQDTATFTISRALTGMAVAANVLNPAVVGDIFFKEQRGTAMSCIMFAPLIASSVGPAFSGLIAENYGWRAVIWMSVIFAATCEVVFLTCFRETYRMTILRKAFKKDKYKTPDQQRALNLEKSSESLLKMIMRPFVVFFGSGVLMALSVFNCIIFSYFYIVATTLPNILEEIYLFSPSMTGMAFLANGVGTLIGVMICKSSLDKIYIRLTLANDGIGQPEYRLPLPIIGAFTMPPAVALYGWCAQLHLPFAVFMFATVWVRVSMTLAFLPLMSYVVDACGIYSASALTGVIVTRCLAGALFPLAIAEMIEGLGYGWGFTVLGLLNVVAGIVPIMLMRYGSRWRQSSEYTRNH